MTLVRAIACATLLLLGACAATSRIAPELPASLVDFLPEASVRELWTVDVGSLSGAYDARLGPALDGNTLFVANAAGRVRALAKDSGRRLWVRDFDFALTSGVAVGEGLVVVGTRKGDVMALDMSTGESRWNGKVASEVQAPVAISRGMVVVQSVDGKITALSASDGKRLWVSDRSEPALSLRGTGTPIIAADFVLAGFANGKIVALRLGDGKLLWEHVVAQPRGRNEIERLVDVDAAPVLWGENLFAVAYQGKVIAVDMRSGRVMWSRDASSYLGIDVDRNAVFLADDKGQVLAFDQRGGSSLWRQSSLHGRRLSAPVQHGSAVVIGDFEGYLHWLARDDGRPMARYRLDDSAVQARSIADGATLYAASQSGRLAALQLVPSK